jgi:ribonucleoside-diphosphate reductase beta chain
MLHQTFVTTSRGLRRASLPMRLYEKAKKLGIWNPSDIDLSQDKKDWAGLSAIEKEIILRLTSMFQAGEEAVTLDLLPLIQVIAGEGRLEEEMFLTTFLFEEAKHTDFFRRFLDEVAGVSGDLSGYAGQNYRQIVYQALPEALTALSRDSSPAAQVRASVTYNLIVEGVLAETGYHAYFAILERNNLLPGVRRGISLLKQDESRHIAYGIYLLSRLIAANPELWPALENHMNTLLAPAVGVISDIFALYDPAPFGLREDDFVEYAMDQFSKRFERIERARGLSLDEIERVAVHAIDESID